MANNPDKLLADFLSVKEVLTTIAIRIEDNLQEIVRDLKHVDRVQSRIKEEGSFLKKALKKEKDKWKYKVPFKEIQDLIGARIVVYYKNDVEVVKEEIKRFFNLVEHKTFVQDDVAKFGYEGFHMICFIPSSIYSDHKANSLIPDFFELQIKTLYQHAWSQANHGLGYKPGAELTYDEERKLAFIAAQSWGADSILSELDVPNK